MGALLRPYGAENIVDGIPLITRGAVDFLAAPTFQSGDAKISKDGGAAVNLTAIPTVVPSGGTSVRISLTTAELTCARAVITLIDQTSPKAWEDQKIIVETYGHASSQHPNFGVVMRGTDSANTVVPDAAGTAATLIAGLNDPSAAAIVTAIFAATGITAGGAATFAEIQAKLLAAATWNFKLVGTNLELYDDDNTRLLATIPLQAAGPRG